MVSKSVTIAHVREEAPVQRVTKTKAMQALLHIFVDLWFEWFIIPRSVF
jgi:hypothetical protein